MNGSYKYLIKEQTLDDSEKKINDYVGFKTSILYLFLIIKR